MVALVNYLVAEKFKEKTGIDVISLPKYTRLDTPVSAHADMLLSVIDNYIFIYEEYYEANKVLFLSLEGKYKIVKIKQECKREYPGDIALNVLVIGKKIFCKVKNVAAEIISYAKENGYKLINISQGYSACSTLVINENTAITGDKGVYNALIKEKVKTLLISAENIKLDGYNHGFIGGCGVVLDNKLYLLGEIKYIPDCDKIVELLNEENCTCFEILTGDVCDFGGIKLLNL